MFEAELELEKKESSVIPLVLVLVLAGLILGGVGGVVYMVVQTKRGVPAAEAAAVIEQTLKQEGPNTTHFRVGLVKSSVSEKPLDPHYKLLEKIGLITYKVQKDQNSAQVGLTPDGEKKLATLDGVQKEAEADGTTQYILPLAERKLVEVSSITMDGPSRARVIYTWRWDPNEIGNSFDASGQLVKSFNQWDRMTLIQKYNAAYYHSEPVRTGVMLSKKDGKWVALPPE